MVKRTKKITKKVDVTKISGYLAGADGKETTTRLVMFKYSTSYKRDNGYKKLRLLGVMAKNISKSIDSKAYKYRYILNVWK